ETRGVGVRHLSGIWGVETGTAQEVYTVGAAGLILRRSGGRWAVEADGMTAQDLNAVGGCSATEVYAVGEGGVVLRRGGDGKWQAEAPVTGAGLTGVLCSGDEVYAVGSQGTILRRTAGAWQQEGKGTTGERLSG